MKDRGKYDTPQNIDIYVEMTTFSKYNLSFYVVFFFSSFFSGTYLPVDLRVIYEFEYNKIGN